MRGLFLGLLILAGCGSGGLDGPCSVTLSVSPSDPTAPVIISASASFSIDDPMVSGVQHASWLVIGPSGTLAFDSSDEGRTITFHADTPGLYSIAVSGDVGGTTCHGDSLDLDVLAQEDAVHELVLQYLPPPGSGLPAQQDPQHLIIHRLVGSELDPVRLSAGREVSGSLFGPGGGLSGSLVLSPLAGGERSVLYAGADGAYAGRLGEPGPWSLVAVPDDMLVPPEQRTVSESDLDAAITLTGGETLAGQVFDGNGLPVVGATVRVAQPLLPGTLATTDGAGRFFVNTRGGALSVDIVPTEASGLPGVAVPPEAGIVAQAGQAVRVDLPQLASVPVSATIKDQDGTPLPFGRARFELGGGGSAQIAQGGTSQAVPLALTREVIADQNGAFSTSLPVGTYQVLVEPQPGNQGDQRLVSREVVIGGPMTLDLATATAIAMPILVEQGGQPVRDARVEARVLHGIDPFAPPITGTTDLDGRVILELPRGTSVSVTVRGELAARTVTIPVTLDGETIAVAPGHEVTGRVLGPQGASLAGVVVRAQCLTCGDDAPEPVASAITTATGFYRLVVPEPLP